MNNIESGSIVVLHDSLKSIDRLKGFLPQLLKDLRSDDFEFALL